MTAPEAVEALLAQWAAACPRPEVLAAAAAAGPLDLPRAETADDKAERLAAQDHARAALWELRIPADNRGADLARLLPQQDEHRAVTGFLTQTVKPTLCLAGPGRTGKSNAAAAVGNAARAAGRTCVWWDAPELWALLCDTSRHDDETRVAARRAAEAGWAAADLAVLDDLGAEPGDKPWGPWPAALWTLLGGRAGNGLRTVITLNPVDGDGQAVDAGPGGSRGRQVAGMLERRYGARAANRILEFCVPVWVGGPPVAPPTNLAALFR